MKFSFFARTQKYLYIILTVMLLAGISFRVDAAKDGFTVVIDPGHGGNDHGAIDNKAREKDINLAVGKRLGELLRKKQKDIDVVFTRDDDTFVSLQGRADIANKAKGDLFISIHTNSVDAKNKNRTTVAGASVYTLGNHKDDANMGVARRENSVIELEDGYKQKYSGFDPSKDESYIIFEMAQRNTVAQSNRFAKMVQDNLVNIAGRKNRGVHQAGFWVLWSTSMPSVLIELDFICNPTSAKFMTSKEGVDKLAEAIYEAVVVYVKNQRQARRMAEAGVSPKAAQKKSIAKKASGADSRKTDATVDVASENIESPAATDVADEPFNDITDKPTSLALAYVPQEESKDMTHSMLLATKNQRKPRTTADGRRRRSASSRKISAMRNVEGEIRLFTEFTGQFETIKPTLAKETAPVVAASDQNADKKKKKTKSAKKDKSKATAKADTSKFGKSANKKAGSGNKAELSEAAKAGIRMKAEAKERKKREKEERKLAKESKSDKETAAIGGNESHAASRKSLRSHSSGR
ncbi:MAG: N-acetylmuramoyl-L-alanine amidase [Muribaculaceae bacterium]|nr:N-acetylmuramoyl-L-alanine amidase [Muribaculaceae bacterium]